MVFLSLPYSHQYKDVVDYRIKMAVLYAAHLMREGLIPVSPIIFGSKILEHVNLPSDFETWDKLCYAYLDNCKEIHILCIDGWKQSKGVAGEIAYALEKGKEIKYINVSNPQDGIYYYSENKEEMKRHNFTKRLRDELKK
jgi:hypothetical protein